MPNLTRRLLIAHEALDPYSLHDRARHYEPETTPPLTDIIDDLTTYLETRGGDTMQRLPAWTDFKRTAADYGIEI